MTLPRRGYVRAILVAIGLQCAVVTGAFAQADYSEEKLKAFVAATVAAETMARKWMQVINGTTSESLADTYRAQANADMIGAIRNTEGITYEEYVDMVKEVRADPALAQRVQDIYMARIPQ